jgi:hypothetical protein
VGEEIDVQAHTIRIFLADDAVERLVAVGASRASPGGRGAAAADPAARAPGAPTRAGPPRAGLDPRPDPREPSEPTDTAGTGAPPPDDRAVAHAQDLVMRADSLDVIAPGEILERVIAVGRARAVSSARDSLNTPDTPPLIRADWIEGDTVIAYLRLDTTAAGPEGGSRPDRAAPDAPLASGSPSGAERDYVLDRLEAMQGARTLYRLDPDSTRIEDESGEPVMTEQDEAPGAAGDEPTGEETGEEEEAGEAAAAGEPQEGEPAPVAADSLPATPRARLPVSYVEADRITIDFVDGSVDVMHVVGLRQGLYLEPSAAPRRAANGGGSSP